MNLPIYSIHWMSHNLVKGGHFHHSHSSLHKKINVTQRHKHHNSNHNDSDNEDSSEFANRKYKNKDEQAIGEINLKNKKE